MNYNERMKQNMFMNAQAKEKAKEEAKKRRQANDSQRVADASGISRKEIKKDFDAGAALGKEILGTGLGRITDDADVRSSKDLMRTRAQEGLSDIEENAMRDKGLANIQGAEQKAQRGLNASLARSGVRGGAAGQMQVELAAANVNNRRSFETDLLMNDEATKRKSELDFANFSTKIAEFDLGQAAKEKNIMLQTQLATAQLGSTERGATKNMIAQERAAAAKNGCHVKNTKVKLSNGAYKKIQDIKIGDELALGGKVLGRGEILTDEDMYTKNSEVFTESHLVPFQGTFIPAGEHPDCLKISSNSANIVYPLFTENKCYLTSFISGDFAMENYHKEEREWLLEELKNLKKA